jgi:hypothetical protein
MILKNHTRVILSEGVTVFVTPESKDPYSGISLGFQPGIHEAQCATTCTYNCFGMNMICIKALE